MKGEEIVQIFFFTLFVYKFTSKNILEILLGDE